MSGSFGGIESVPNAFIAGLQAQNERGGIAGHPVQALFCRGNAASCMQEAFDKGAVALAVSLFVEGDILSVKAAFQSHGLTQIASQIGIDPASTDLGETDLATTAPGALSPEAEAVLYRSLGVRSYVAVPPSSYRAMGTSFSPDVAATLERAGVRRRSTPVRNLRPDIEVTARELAATKADMVLLGGMSPDEEVGLLEAMEAIGYRPKFTRPSSLSPPTLTPEQVERLAPILNDRYFIPVATLPVWLTSNVEVQRFQAEMAAGTHSGLTSLAAPYTDLQLRGWITAQGVLAILRSIAGGVFTPTTFTAAAQAAVNLDLGGIAAPWTPFEDVDPETPGRQSRGDFYVVTVKDGAVTLLDQEPRCGKLDGCDN
jgi:hypothetical protein